MSALRRTTTLLAAPLLALGLATAAAPTASAAGSSLAWGGYSNGKIPSTALCAIPWSTQDSLRCDATRKLTSLNAAYKARFGANLCINDGYRSYTKQVSLFKKYGSPRAAKPGTSTHGWGLAVDFGCSIGTYTGTRYKWLTTAGKKYGWAQPSWAVAKGSNPEPWHWQYFGTYVPTTPPTPTPTPPPPPPPPPAPVKSKAVTAASLSVTGTWPRTATFALRVKSTGKAVPGARVSIATRAADSSTYTTVRTATTDSQGRVSYTDTPESPVYVRFTFAGSTTAKPTYGVRLLSTVTELSGRYVRDRRHPLVVGRLTTPGRDAVADQMVTLERRLAGSTTWTPVESLRTDEDGYVWSEAEREQSSTYRFTYPGATGYVGDVGDEIAVTKKR
ncbi:M15 family metallopeptidase [Phycicoccus sp. MAQZ13P-2]|uniref:M15 family metallopeptidase n=1 Tax=Phycicoccus mangrovi TaxID=2840470 RepID=UPI001BFFE749|nr:M15 family metallopeptidase [Phycicoccus mangrovi]MBT9254984.1 M15 family metallopeptidase [Phycicoccus mangrovi]MBT9256019.1 M15 family metallopeptidase [Phycicoccus mangrovi]MBT9273968.1 M15 family metallopeptidase [Phycicoccus mangrovi]